MRPAHDEVAQSLVAVCAEDLGDLERHAEVCDAGDPRAESDDRCGRRFAVADLHPLNVFRGERLIALNEEP